MKTTERAPGGEAERWVVDVVDARDLERQMPGYRRRFTFTDAVDAWECLEKAQQAGFLATAERVKRV